jgi:hypothetical protein
MGNKRSHNHRQQVRKPRAAHVPPIAPLAPPAIKRVFQYGKPFTLLEDESKATFEYKTGAWVRYSLSIAECREQNYKVNELPQKVNRMTRYEVCRPLDA